MGIGTLCSNDWSGRSLDAPQQQCYNAASGSSWSCRGAHKLFNIKQQAAGIRRNLNETIATITAGRVEPVVLADQLVHCLEMYQSQGGAEYATSIDNATLALAGAQTQAAIYRYRPARIARTTGNSKPLVRDLQG
jgi:hypothetical protein